MSAADIREARLEVFNVQQGTPEWLALHLGIPTASQFAIVLRQEGRKKGSPSETRRKYLLQLAGEILTGQVAENFTSAAMERGKEMEAEARQMYALSSDEDPTPIGFMRRGRAGASPDSLVGEDGLLEIKTKAPHLQLEALLDGILPPEHAAQVQGQLLISGRQWCDFVSYWPRLPLLTVRVHRDEAYIAELASAIQKFNAELDELVAYFRRNGAPEVSVLQPPSGPSPAAAKALSIPSPAEAF